MKLLAKIMFKKQAAAIRTKEQFADEIRINFTSAVKEDSRKEEDVHTAVFRQLTVAMYRIKKYAFDSMFVAYLTRPKS